jgi:hypothetical protein
MAKTTKRKKKRKLSAAQKAALKKGQAALKRWRSQQKKTGTRKKTVKKRTATKTTTRKVSSRRRSGGNKLMVTKRLTRGISTFARKSNAVEMLQDAGLVVVAGITSGYLTSKLPISDSRVRSLVPIGAGIALAALTGRKNKIAKGVSQGMVILGTVSLFKQLAPGVPMLAGERIIILPANGMGRRLSMTNSGKATLGRRVRMAGNSVVPYRTAANT